MLLLYSARKITLEVQLQKYFLPIKIIGDTMKRIIFISMLIGIALLIISFMKCGSIEGGDPFTGLFTLAITDTPIDDVSKVIIKLTGIELQSALGERLNFDFRRPRKIDLLALRAGGKEFLLTDKPLSAGHYDWIRLKVEADPNEFDSYIEFKSGLRCSLMIPSSDKTCLKLVRRFNIPLGGIADYTIDFNLRKSIHHSSGKRRDYILRPVLRIVDNAEVGSISGTIDPVLINNPDDPTCAVYIFEGLEVTPDDIGKNYTDPITMATVKFDSQTGQYVYKAAFLDAGDYTLALTYQAQDYDPATDKQIKCEKTAQVIIFPGSVTNYDFQQRRSTSFCIGYKDPQYLNNFL